MVDHKHGEMDIKTQEETFVGFIRIVTWTAVASIATLIFLALVNG